MLYAQKLEVRFVQIKSGDGTFIYDERIIKNIDKNKAQRDT